MLHPNDIRNATVRLTCDSVMGTGFFIEDGIILTARHVVLDHIEDGAPIKVALSSEAGEVSEITVALVADDEYHDIAILMAAQQSRPALPGRLCFARIRDRWRAYGFPSADGPDGSCFEGVVEQYTPGSIYDLLLRVDEDITAYNYSGLSGAPLILGNFSVGIVVSQNGPKLNAVSLLSLDEFLRKNGIHVEQEASHSDLPGDLAGLGRESVPNDNVTRKLAAALPNAHGRILLLHGSPGSGKTVQVAKYAPGGAENCELIGKYFIRVPGDKTLPSRRASTDFFLDWMGNAIHIALRGIPPEVSSATPDQRAEEIVTWMYELGRKLAQQGKFGLLVVDGIDDLALYGTSPEAFLTILSGDLPPNICVLLSCTSKAVLPPFIKNRVQDDCEVEVDPLEQEACLTFLQRKLAETDLSLSQLKMLSEKTEGHPLYMHYLIELVKGQCPKEVFDDWLASIPPISGDIRKYYERIWDTSLAGSPNRTWTMATLAKLRQPVSPTELYGMLPESAQTSFSDTMPALSHLLKVAGGLEIYHTSFAAFLDAKTSIQDKNIHDRIAGYCASNPDSEYAIPNCIFHHARSSKPCEAIEQCNQGWADRCALHFVAPDLVLSDAVLAESVAINLGCFSSFVRIKLLLQRLRFRYNNDLRQNAFFMADTLVSLGAPDEALKHIIRQGHLLASNDDVLYILQKMYENDAQEVAEKLQQAIEMRYVKEIEGVSKSGVLECSTIVLKNGAVTLSANVDTPSAFQNHAHLIRALSRSADHLVDTGGDASGPETLRQFCSGQFLGYLMWSRDIYPTIDELRKQGKCVIDEKSIAFLVFTAKAYLDYRQNSELPFEDSSVLVRLAHDIEILIDQYGIPTDRLQREILLDFLAKHSKRVDIVEDLADPVPSGRIPYCLRAENGVDLEAGSVSSLLKDSFYAGFMGQDSLKDEAMSVEEHWEELLLRTIEQISHVLGRCCRARAEDKDIAASARGEVFALIAGVDFSLEERVKWNRSYGLPEEILPAIFNQFTDYFILYDKAEVASYAEMVVARASKQFGIYTEGTREVLLDIARRLSRFPEHHTSAGKIICLLEKHVTESVLNRIERTPLLLQACQLYAQIGNLDGAMLCYRKMLDTLMGPSWYKEDQFSLVNTALDLHLPDAEFLFHCGTYEKCLEYASGELTFQRYVRYAKEALVGSLASKGRVSEAIAYLRNQTLPAPSVIWQRVTRNSVDSLSPGKGYENGANCITLPGATVQLLKQCGGVNIAVVWALAEILIINDDIERYRDFFLDIMGQTIESSRDGKAVSPVKLLQRLAQVTTHTALADSIVSVQDRIRTTVTAEHHEQFVLLLEEQSVFLDSEKFPSPSQGAFVAGGKVQKEGEAGNGKESFSGFPGMGTLPSFAKVEECYKEATEHLAAGNKTLARKQIVEGFRHMQKHGANLWASNLSGSCTGLLEALLAVEESPEDFLRTLAPFAVDHFTEDWRVVDRILCLLKDRIPQETATDVNRSVAAHLNFILRPPDDLAFTSCISSGEEATSAEDALCEFIIWLLNYPDPVTKARTYGAIEWLLLVAPETIVSFLIGEALSGIPRDSCELCASLLSGTQNSQVAGIAWDCIRRDGARLKAVVRLKHFSIKHNLVMLFGDASFADSEFSPFYSDLCRSVPDYVTDGEFCSTNDSKLYPLGPELDELNRRRLLDRDFFLNLDALLGELGPKGIKYYVRHDHFVDRSFAIDHTSFPRTYQAILRYAVNCALSRRVEQDVAQIVWGCP